MDKIELPLGFGMALAQNEVAMKAFEAMSESDKMSLIDKTHNIRSSDEMHQFVNSLAENHSAES